MVRHNTPLELCRFDSNRVNIHVKLLKGSLRLRFTLWNAQMCCAVASVPSPEQVTPDAPLRLEIAAKIAFPDGSMTASGLRREADRGHLVIERIAGKDYTTLVNIERM